MKQLYLSLMIIFSYATDICSMNPFDIKALSSPAIGTMIHPYQQFELPGSKPFLIRLTESGYWISDVPLIGIYTGPYDFKQTRAAISLPPSSFKFIPDSLKNSLAQQGINQPNALSSIYILITESTMPNSPINVLFHTSLTYWRNSGAYTSADVLMGLFEPNGVMPAPSDSISFGRFDRQNVNYHEPNAISPNNARFSLEPNRSLASFWLAAISPDNPQQYVIAFEIVGFGDAISNQLQKAANAWQPQTISALIAHLRTISNMLSGPDQVALRQAIDTMITLMNVPLSPAEIARQKAEAERLRKQQEEQQRLTEATARLNAFAQALEELIQLIKK